MKKLFLTIALCLFYPIQGTSTHIYNKTTITITHGDITRLHDYDAIVNAANSSLQHGSGVALAIAKAAGKNLQQYCIALPSMGTQRGEKCCVGKAVITPAFNLERQNIQWIIHAVGPRIAHGKTPSPQDAQLLYDAYFNSLVVAHLNGCKSIAFPAISTAIFGYDIRSATPVALRAVTDFIDHYPDALEKITFVLFSTQDYAFYVQTVASHIKPTTLAITPRFASVVNWVRTKLF